MKRHPEHGTNKLVSDFYCRVSKTPLKGGVIENKVVQTMRLPTQYQLVTHACKHAIPDYSRDKAMDLTGTDLTPSLRKLPLCNNLLRRAMLMKPPEREIKDEPVLSEKEYLKKLKKIEDTRKSKKKKREQASCPYGCGWATNYKYKKQVVFIN